MGDEEMSVVAEIAQVIVGVDVVERLEDPGAELEIKAMFARLAEPDFEIQMVANPESGAPGLETRGPDGFLTVWEDWTQAYRTFTIELEDRIDAGEKVLTLVRQRGRTRVGDVEMEAHSAAVWTVRDGKLTKVEFHLDPDEAKRSAGLQ